MTDPITRLNAALEGRYRIEREIGEGGMATVYLADDLKHDRKVALKLLKPELAAVVGAERFLAEIKTTANLQHPHILPLFDSGEADGFLYFVMPYVAGDTLRDKIDREKQLSLAEAVKIAERVAAALDYAHKHGVVHRDIKPGNILLSAEGEPTIADFGIALAVAQAGRGRVTETGLSMGTPSYMSPEQATGDRDVDPRTDVYALGCVLYEMLIGEPPYTGSTAQAILGKIIQGAPISATDARGTVPRNIDAAIRKALEKLPADRFASAQEFARALGDPSFRHGEAAAATARAGGPGWLVPTLAIMAVMSTIGFGWSLRRSPEPPPVTRQVLGTQGWAGLEGSIGRLAALAPDGSSMILPMDNDGRIGLGLKRRESASIEFLPGTEGALEVVYSPDGRSIAYAVDGELRTRSFTGGGTVTLAQGIEAGFGSRVALDWLDDGTILYEYLVAGGRQIARISLAGDVAPDTVWGTDEIVAPVWIKGLPGSRGALVIDCAGIAVACDVGRSRLHVLDLTDHSSRVIRERVAAAWYVPTGHLVYVQADGAVVATAFDLDALEPVGVDVSLFQNIRIASNAADFRIGADGTLLYVEGASFATGGRQVVWVDRQGGVQPVDPNWVPGGYADPALSPDGRRLALSVATESDPGNLWVKELPDGPFTPLTNEEGISQRPAWSADGDQIAYVAQSGPLRQAYLMRSDASAMGIGEELFRRDANVSQVLFTNDPRTLLFQEVATRVSNDQDIGTYDLDTGQARMLLASAFNEQAAALSGDGRWLAYVSNLSGRNEVYVRPFPDVGGRTVPVSVGGGAEAVWAHSGREIFYREAASGRMFSARVQTEPTFQVLERVPLFDASAYLAQGGWRTYDVDVTDDRFIMLRSESVLSDQGDTRLILVQNWFTELEALMGAGR